MIAAAAAPLARSQPQRRGRFISLQVKVLLAFTLVFSLLFGAVFLWFYNLATANALASIKESLTYTINGAVAGINGDEFEALVAEGQRRQDGLTDDPRYWSELAWLGKVHDLDPRAYPYSYIPGPDKPDGKQTNYFIVDYLQTADPSRAAGFKEQWTLNSGASRGGLDELTYKLTPYTDNWGKWVSAYAPIKDSQGKVVGALGVDFRADYVYQVQSEILAEFVPAIIATYAILVLLVYVLARALSDPLRALTRAALRVGEGDYDQNLDRYGHSRLKDEITSLADVFQLMVSKVREREQSLVRRVEQLTIEIDEAKRQHEVSAIVDTDFFQGLQGRAQSMRQRRRQLEAVTEDSEPRAEPAPSA